MDCVKSVVFDSHTTCIVISRQLTHPSDLRPLFSSPRDAICIRFTSVRTCARVYLCKHRAGQGRGMRGASRGVPSRAAPLRSPDPLAALRFLLRRTRDFSRRRGRALRVGPVEADDSDGRPCGLLLYHRRGETTRWRPKTTTTAKKKKKRGRSRRRSDRQDEARREVR